MPPSSLPDRVAGSPAACWAATSAASPSTGSSTRCRPPPGPSGPERDDECVFCALLRDIGDILGSFNHADIATAMVKPFVTDENLWMVQQHGMFQGYYFFHHLGLDRDLRDQFLGQRVVRLHGRVLRRVRPARVRPGLRHQPAGALRAAAAADHGLAPCAASTSPRAAKPSPPPDRPAGRRSLRSSSRCRCSRVSAAPLAAPADLRAGDGRIVDADGRTVLLRGHQRQPAGRVRPEPPRLRPRRCR